MNFWNNKKTFSKMIFSYIAVLIIPLIFGGSLYLTTVNIYRKDVDAANLQVLQNVQDNVSVNLSGMSNMMQALFNEGNVITLSNRADYINFDYVSMSSLQKKVSMSLFSNSYIEDILIYFHKSDFLLTSNTYLNHVKKMTGYSPTIGLTVQEFTNLLGKEQNFDLRILSQEQGNRAFLIASDGPTSGRTARPNVTIMVRVKSGLLSKLMVSKDCRTFMVDQLGNSLASEPGTSVSGSSGDWTLNPSGEKTRVVESTDPSFSLNYVRFIPSEIYSRNLSSIQLLAAIFLLLCLLLCIPVSISVAKRNYDPIRRILSLIPYSPDGRDSDDYKVISNSISGLLQRDKVNELERDDRSMILRNYLFYRLIDDPRLTEKGFLEECGKCGIKFENTAFLLVGFLIENGSNLFFEMDESTNEEMSQLLFIAITNILRESIGAEYRFFTAEYKGGYFTLVNVDARLDKDVAVDEIKLACEHVADRLDTDFRAIVSAVISNIHTGFPKIRRCYQEIEEIIREQNRFKRSAYVVQYREMSSKAGPPPSGLPQEAGHSSRKDSEKKSSIRDICAYIDENYSNADLTVGAVSERFEMTTANLSLYFKRKMGVSPLEYIQLKRVSEAKRLIDTTQKKIFDIAQEVGYYDTRPLIRSFKRIEGMTPAEYRDLKRELPSSGC